MPRVIIVDGRLKYQDKLRSNLSIRYRGMLVEVEATLTDGIGIESRIYVTMPKWHGKRRFLGEADTLTGMANLVNNYADNYFRKQP